jgi:hypothetical protein
MGDRITLAKVHLPFSIFNGYVVRKVIWVLVGEKQNTISHLPLLFFKGKCNVADMH